MPDAHGPVEAGAESETAVEPQARENELAPEAAGAELDLGLELGLTGAGHPAATRTGQGQPLPPGLRARAIGRVQRQQGNFAVQRMLKRATDGEDWLAQRIDSASGGGQALEPQAQARLEDGLGDSLDGVRVHTDGEATQLADAVEAVAFTSGQDIFFGAGTYQPGTSQGMELLAHEAAHTMQQASGPVAGSPAAGGIIVSDPADPFEQAAERTARQVMQTAPNSALPNQIDDAPTLGGQSIQRAERPKDEADELKKPAPEPTVPEMANPKKPEELL